MEVGDAQVLESGAETGLFFHVLLQQALEGQEGAVFLLLVLTFVMRPPPLQE